MGRSRSRFRFVGFRPREDIGKFSVRLAGEGCLSREATSAIALARPRSGLGSARASARAAVKLAAESTYSSPVNFPRMNLL
jgi:hypothetical protein